MIWSTKSVRCTRQALWLAIPFALALLSAASASADCTDFAGNQVANCGFEEGHPPSDWTPTYGEEFQQRAPGLEGLHAASIVPESTPPFGYWGLLIRSECFPIAEDTTYRYGAYVRRSSDAGSCRALIEWFYETDCTGAYFAVDSPTVQLIAGEWLLLEGEDIPPGRSGRLRVSCVTSGVGGPAGPEVLIDGAYAIPLTGLNEIPDLGFLGRLVFALLVGVLGTTASTRR